MKLFEFLKNNIKGILLSAVLAWAAGVLAGTDFAVRANISSIVIAILLGFALGNFSGGKMPADFNPGVTFSQKRILRFAIIFYGFRLTFQDVAQVGVEGLMIDAVMLLSTFFIGLIVGIKIFKMDRDTAVLCAAGSSICGAAAVIATEPVLKAESHKVALAVGTVVLFGTLAMFLYPAVYHLTGFSDLQFGIFTGSTVHEVAQVVAVGGVISEQAQHTAVISKLGRVMMLAPFLIGLSFFINRGEGGAKGVSIPWFAVLFIVVVGFNSFGFLDKNAVDVINKIDGFLLTAAMAALGIGTDFKKIKAGGGAPVYTAGIMFIWLIFGGYMVNKLLMF